MASFLLRNRHKRNPLTHRATSKWSLGMKAEWSESQILRTRMNFSLSRNLRLSRVPYLVPNRATFGECCGTPKRAESSQVASTYVMETPHPVQHFGIPFPLEQRCNWGDPLSSRGTSCPVVGGGHEHNPMAESKQVATFGSSSSDQEGARPACKACEPLQIPEQPAYRASHS